MKSFLYVLFYHLLKQNKIQKFQNLLKSKEIFHPSAKLCQSYEQTKFGLIKDGKELTKEVLRKCRKYLCEEIKFTSSMEAQDLDQLVSLQYQMHCSAYNCLCSLFIRTQTEPKLYQAFLFKDDVAKVNTDLHLQQLIIFLSIHFIFILRMN